MLINTYFELLKSKIDEIAADTESMQKAADLCVQALTQGGAIHIFDSGHLVSHELVRRAGGLVALNRLAFSLNVDNLVRARADESPAQTLSFGYIKHIFDTNQLRTGDVLFVGSVSGKSARAMSALGSSIRLPLTVSTLPRLSITDSATNRGGTRSAS